MHQFSTFLPHQFRRYWNFYNIYTLSCILLSDMFRVRYDINFFSQCRIARLKKTYSVYIRFSSNLYFYSRYVPSLKDRTWQEIEMLRNIRNHYLDAGVNFLVFESKSIQLSAIFSSVRTPCTAPMSVIYIWRYC